MSIVNYRYVFEENILGNDGGVLSEHRKNLPHAVQIMEEAEKSFNDLHMERFFDGILKNNIASCALRCCISPEGELVGIIKTTAKPGYRLSEKRRNAIFNQLDGQLSDGWGECFFGYVNIMKDAFGQRFVVE